MKKMIPEITQILEIICSKLYDTTQNENEFFNVLEIPCESENIIFFLIFPHLEVPNVYLYN